jgi:hypothetical protein
MQLVPGRAPRRLRLAALLAAGALAAWSALPHAAEGVTPEELTTSDAIGFEVHGRASFTTRQVNVNAAGQNVVGDGANEPTIAVDPVDPRHIVIGWRQFATVTSGMREAGFAHSHDGGLSWTAGTLTPGVGRSDPVVNVDSQGTFLYYSFTGPPFFPSYRGELFRATRNGATWRAPVLAGGGDKPWMTVDRSGGIGNGHVYASWRTAAACCGSRVFTRSTNRGVSFQTPIALPRVPQFGTLSVGPSGELYVVGYDQGQLVVLRSTNARDATQTPTFAVRNGNVDLGGVFGGAGSVNPDGILAQVWVDVDRSTGPRRGWVYMLASVSPPGDPIDTMMVRSSDGGATWSAPRRVNDDAAGAWQWFGTMSVAPSGRIDAVWNDSRGNAQPSQTRLFYSYSTDGGATWAPNEAATPVFDSTVGAPQNARKLGDYYHMVSDATGARLAFAATFGGEHNVYFMRIVADADLDGVHDGEEEP